MNRSMRSGEIGVVNGMPAATIPLCEPQQLGTPDFRCYSLRMYSQKFNVYVVIRGVRCACPLEWLDQFCMRNFTNAAEFDDTLPVEEGRVEASFRVTPERFAESFGAWLTRRGKGEGQALKVEVTSA